MAPAASDNAPSEAPAPPEIPSADSVSAAPNVAAIGRSLYDLISNARGNPKQFSAARKPDPFDGKDDSKLNTFLLQLGIYFRSNPDAFPSDIDKVHFALSYLKGTALEFFEPELLQIEENGEPDWLEDYSQFVQELRTNFGPYDEAGDAEAKLSKLHMDDGKRVTEYITEFNRLSTKVEWGDAALRYSFYSGLCSRLKDDITQHGKPKRLTLMKQAAQTYDARYWERRGETRRNNPANSGGNSSQNKGNSASAPKAASTPAPQPAAAPNNNRNASSGAPQRQGNPSAKSGSGNSGGAKPSSNRPDLSSKLGKNGKLTPQERERRMKEGLCLFCGQSGHMARDCPRSTSSAFKARAAQLDSSDAPPSEEQSKE